MRSEVVRACVAVVFGFAASPVMAQTADTEIAIWPGITLLPDSIGAPDSIAAPAPGSVPAPDSITAPDSVAATDSVAAPALDSARIGMLQFMVQNFGDVRVVTNGVAFVRRDAVVSPDGLRVSGDDRRLSSFARPEHLVPWAEIESIQVRKGTGNGPAVGAAIGLAIGFSIYIAQMPVAIFSLGAEQPSETPILVGLLGGAALGWLVDRPGPWRTVYP